MCGIAGSISSRSALQPQHLNVITHRGPDDEGYYADGAVALGHRRLSIIDVSANGHQPMQTADGNYVLIFNGEIYNHADIRKDLLNRGFQFKSTSDTETLLYGYIAYGTALFEKLNGIFAFAIYDKQQQQVVIVRDQFGIKPLYYYDRNGMFAFASEIKVLTQLQDFDKTLDPSSFYYYLQLLYAPQQITPFQHVKKLMPGSYMMYDVKQRSFSTHQYYRYQFNERSNGDEASWINKTETALLKAVERQLMSDVPLGFFLSGGLDSSLIVAMAKKIVTQQQLTCFSIDTGKDLESEGFANDLYYAKKVAAHLNVKLEVVPASTDILQDFDKMIWHLDEPQADAAPLNVYNICNGARQQGIKVLLGGAAGDDLFSGYRRHQAIRLEKYFRFIPSPIAKAADVVADKFDISNPLVRRVKKITEQLGKSKAQRFAGYYSWLAEKEITPLFSQHTKHQIQKEVLPMQLYSGFVNDLPNNTHDLNAMLYLDMMGFLPDHNLNYTDKLSMAASVETRVPFLDTELVDLACKMPTGLKMKGNTTKYVLKKVAEKYLPNDVIYRPKTGFAAPVRVWIKNEMKEMINDRLSESNINRRGLFDAKKVQQLISRNESGKVDASYSIWALLAIESWLRQFYD